jgi:hypothetical protein
VSHQKRKPLFFTRHEITLGQGGDKLKRALEIKDIKRRGVDAVPKKLGRNLFPFPQNENKESD